MKCAKCGVDLHSDDVYEYAGQTLCEDCYLDLVATPKACDPWAVHSAKKMSKNQLSLTPLQEKILNLIKEGDPLTAEEICEQLGISESEFRSNFVPLRHMELARACKEGNKVCYTLFDS